MSDSEDLNRQELDKEEWYPNEEYKCDPPSSKKYKKDISKHHFTPLTNYPFVVAGIEFAGLWSSKFPELPPPPITEPFVASSLLDHLTGIKEMEPPGALYNYNQYDIDDMAFADNKKLHPFYDPRNRRMVHYIYDKPSCILKTPDYGEVTITHTYPAELNHHPDPSISRRIHHKLSNPSKSPWLGSHHHPCNTRLQSPFQNKNASKIVASTLKPGHPPLLLRHTLRTEASSRGTYLMRRMDHKSPHAPPITAHEMIDSIRQSLHCPPGIIPICMLRGPHPPTPPNTPPVPIVHGYSYQYDRDNKEEDCFSAVNPNVFHIKYKVPNPLTYHYEADEHISYQHGMHWQTKGCMDATDIVNQVNITNLDEYTSGYQSFFFVYPGYPSRGDATYDGDRNNRKNLAVQRPQYAARISGGDRRFVNLPGFRTMDTNPYKPETYTHQEIAQYDKEFGTFFSRRKTMELFGNHQYRYSHSFPPSFKVFPFGSNKLKGLLNDLKRKGRDPSFQNHKIYTATDIKQPGAPFAFAMRFTCLSMGLSETFLMYLAEMDVKCTAQIHDIIYRTVYTCPDCNSLSYLEFMDMILGFEESHYHVVSYHHIIAQDMFAMTMYIEVFSYYELIDAYLRRWYSQYHPSLLATTLLIRMTPHEWYQVVTHGLNGTLLYLNENGQYVRRRFGGKQNIPYHYVRLSQLPRMFFEDFKQDNQKPNIPGFFLTYRFVQPNIIINPGGEDSRTDPLTPEHVRLLFPNVQLRCDEFGNSVAPFFLQLFPSQVKEEPQHQPNPSIPINIL